MDIKRYQNDLKKLMLKGDELFISMQHERLKDQVEKAVYAQFKDDDKAKSYLEGLPDFSAEYQIWYSEALECVRQLMPSRLDDFIAYYKPLKPRKEATYETYTVSDYLQGLRRTIGGTLIVDADAGLPKFRQQLIILKSLESRFASSLFDIRSLVQADVFDNEVDAAEELLRNGFNRAAGAICGVVLEEHFGEVCTKRGVKLTKKNPTINDYNEALKNAGVIDIATSRNIQYLGDIRNLCDHKRTQEPKKEQVDDLVVGTRKIIKTVM
ncbi:hypothetical protein EYC59_02400 [Candidatus Saccharibacteria bacterium]|nr:MAG: hypothetical protein EYC59_02400 [Candidatus Saccharibacteria bacterium]